MHDTANPPMPLLTPDLREQPLANGRHSGRNHVPLVKFFNPVGIGTWLATELDADGDILFGLAQLNDAPELGSFSLEDLATLELPFGMHIGLIGPKLGFWPSCGTLPERIDRHGAVA